MKILIAEDETLIRLDLRAILQRHGFTVCAEARDGVEAVELAGSESPDLAVLDVKMPRLDGIEAARRILDARPIPIVIVSAFTERSLVRRAADAPRRCAERPRSRRGSACERRAARRPAPSTAPVRPLRRRRAPLRTP